MIDQEKLYNQCLSDNPKERIKAIKQLKDNFSLLPNKEQAWNDLVKLATDKNNSVRSIAAFTLKFAFSYVPDKQQVWNDLIKLATNEDSWVRARAISSLKSVFSDMPDKQQAWNDLIKLTSHENSDVRFKAVSSLKSVFSHVPDKQQAWNDLIKLTNDKDNNVRSIATFALKSVFSHVSNKQQAWNNLVKLTNDKDNIVRFTAASFLGSVFFHVPDKQQVWNDLIRLTSHENSHVRSWAAYTLGSAFPHIPNKQQVRDDLHRLTNNEDSLVRFFAADTLRSVFSQVPDKQQTWNDLHRLTTDQESSVRYEAAYALGSAFSQAPDKQQTWNDLHRLSGDEDIYVRTYANHSLGKVSIFKASNAEKEEDYEDELKKAIVFFEKSAQESLYEWSNPSQFCLPFYRSFHTIIFKRQEEAKEEVDKYLAEAKYAVGNSKSKELLFEAVNNLANALKEVQNLENLDLEAKKGELNLYRKYCDRAAELMIETEETAPFATIAMRKGLPILDRNLKELLEEIQEKAKIACQASQGTPTQEITCSVRREVQKWEISSQEEMSWYVENLIFTLESTIPRTPKNQNFFDRINQIREEKDIVKQYAIVCTIIPLITRVSMDEKIINMEQGIDDVKKGVGIVNEKTTIIIEKLDEIQEELKKGFENLDKLSIKVGGTEGECLKIFSEKLLEITKKGDSETLKHFLEEVLKNEDTLTKEIESSSAPQKEKEESKGSISKLKSLLEKIENLAKEFGKDVANEIVVSYTAKGIVELFLPIMSMAIFGVPIPSQIVDMLANVITELKN